MRKLIAGLVGTAVALTLLTGCSAGDSDTLESTSSTSTTTSTTMTTTTTSTTVAADATDQTEDTGSTEAGTTTTGDLVEELTPSMP